MSTWLRVCWVPDGRVAGILRGSKKPALEPEIGSKIAISRLASGVYSGVGVRHLTENVFSNVLGIDWDL